MQSTGAQTTDAVDAGERGTTLPRASGISTPRLAVGMLAIAAFLRITGIMLGTGHGFDHWTMQVWTRALTENPLSVFYALDLDVPQDHLPGDLLVFAGLGRALTAIAPGIAEGNYPNPMVIKSVAVLADLAIAGLIFVLARRVAEAKTAVMAMSAWLLSPGVLYVSAVWGQWDAVSAAFAVAAVCLTVSGGRLRWLAWLPLAYACLIKPQYALIAPLLLLFAWKIDGIAGLRRSIMGIAGGLGLVQLLSSRFDLGLPGTGMRWSLVERIFASVDEYDAVSLNGHNIWILPIGRGAPFSDQGVVFAGVTYQAFGTLLFALAALVILACSWRMRDPRAALLWGSTSIMFAMFVTMTRMHERYLFPALSLIVLAAIILPRLRIAAVVMHVAYALNVHLAFTNGPSGPDWLQNDLVYRVNALIVIGTFLFVMADGLREAFAPGKPAIHLAQVTPSRSSDPLPAPGD